MKETKITINALNSVWDFKNLDTFGYAFWVLCGLMILIAIAILIWRIVTKQEGDITKKNKKIGSLDPKMNDIALDISATPNTKVLYNILFKNKYSTTNYSLIPILISYKNNLFLVSNLVKAKPKNVIKIDHSGIYKGIASDKLKRDSNIDLKWYNQINKFIIKECLFNDNFKIRNLILIQNEVHEMKNSTDFCTTTPWDVTEVMDNLIAQNDCAIPSEIINDALYKLNSRNLIKMKVTKK
ncbi:hypothetical protein [Mycoplasmopsis pullorum]|uniref:NERD domain-containing protein n=1 Tax=Mycoplasmopsis pullorum TaxID=48003 RepID=A0A1L4FSU2_9BACT|nr:hypothetical protein [Mycoplasmopsis pullorum]APJ38668.1 hypothetical protein BLA55_03340 [Mycoplasmopsis pullorum]